MLKTDLKVYKERNKAQGGHDSLEFEPWKAEVGIPQGKLASKTNHISKLWVLLIDSISVKKDMWWKMSLDTRGMLPGGQSDAHT